MTINTHLLGGTTSTETTAHINIDGSTAKLLVKPEKSDPFFDQSVESDQGTADADGTVHLSLSGLQPDTKYVGQYTVDGSPDPDRRISFKTLPTEGSKSSFRLVSTSCAGHPQSPSGYAGKTAYNCSDSPAFVDILNRDPLITIMNGDWNYADINDGSIADYRASRRANLKQANQRKLWDNTNLFYVVDDHDSFGNDSDSTAPGVSNWKAAWRAEIPDYPLPVDTDLPLFKKVVVGNVLIIGTEERSARSDMSLPNDDPDKTMMGEAQLEWFRKLYDESTHSAIIWVSGSNINYAGDDVYKGGFKYEREIILDVIERYVDRGGATFVASGNTHKMALDKGFLGRNVLPTACFSPLDSIGRTEFKVNFTEGHVGSNGAHGTIDILDDEKGFKINIQGWINNMPWRGMSIRPGNISESFPLRGV